MDYLKWCNVVNPKSRAGYASQEDYELAEQKRIKFVRESSESYRRMRARELAIKAKNDYNNRSDPFVYGQVFNLAFQGII